MQSLRTIDMAITADMSLRVTLHIILDQVMVQLRVDAADILLYKSETQRLEYTDLYYNHIVPVAQQSGAQGGK